MIDHGWREPLPISLLRAPAAVAAAAFLVGVAVGATAGPLAPGGPGSNAQPSRAMTLAITLAVCAPFVLPTTWYRRHRLLWIWMASAAAFATIRAVFMAGFLLPYQPLGVWMLKVSMDFLAAAVLWTAAIAVHRDTR
jgi:hypothetical protein